MTVKYELEVAPEFVALVNNKWLALEGIRLTFNADHTVGIEMTQCFHNAKVVEQFLEPNNGKQVVYQGTLPV